MSVDGEAVRATLREIGRCLGVGDAKGVAGLWDVPGLVLADEGAKGIASRAEVEAFFVQAIAWYREQGTPRAEPELTALTAITDRLVGVDVTWRGLDAAGVERSKEFSHYIMRAGEDGVPRVQVAMSRKVES